jgi:hypothetical protein
MSESAEKYNAAGVEGMILTLRGLKVILDADLARLFFVQTKVLNKALKRNASRFPEDFVFRLKEEETERLRFHFGTSKGRGGRRYAPYAFTEHGAIMVAMVLNSPQAVKMSVFVVRAFARMRQQLVAQKELEVRLTQIESVLLSHDSSIRELFAKIRPLLLPPPEEPPKEVTGFRVKERGARYRPRRLRPNPKSAIGDRKSP